MYVHASVYARVPINGRFIVLEIRGIASNVAFIIEPCIAETLGWTFSFFNLIAKKLSFKL